MTSKDKTIYNALPKLPGFNFAELNEVPSHGRHQYLVLNEDGTRTVKDPNTDVDHAGVNECRCGIPVRVILNHFPQWKTLDDKVLRFFAYYVENVVDSTIEDSRVRKVKIHYFLADGTVSITEIPAVVNSGLQPGTIVSRYKEPHIDVFALSLGGEVECRGIRYQLVDCDAATREFYEVMGIPQPEPFDYPIDKFEASKKPRSKEVDEQHAAMRREVEMQAAKAAGTHASLLTPEERVKARSFFEHDRNVLCFYAVWDKREFRIQYYIADGTIAVMFDHVENDGRDSFVTFTRRGKVPRNARDLLLNTETLNRPVGRATEYLTLDDLRLGATVDIYSRPFFIYDCDPKTHAYMAQKGVPTTPYPRPTAERDFIRVQKTRPQLQDSHTNKSAGQTFGASRMTFEDNTEKKDVLKYTRFLQDVFRFGAVLANPKEIDSGRRFLVCYYLADDTMSVCEILVHNSGHRSGLIFARRRVPEISDPRTLKVGDKVTLDSVVYTLTEMDERTQKYIDAGMPDMDESYFHTGELVVRVQQKILQRFSRTTDAFRQYASSNAEGLTREDVRHMYIDNGFRLTEEELDRVMDRVDSNKDGWVSLADFIETFLNQQFLSDFKPKNEGTSTARGPILSAETLGRRDNAAKVADAAFKRFLTITEARRTLITRAFKGAAAETYDGNLGMQDFVDCLQKRLQVDLAEDELAALLYKFYYSAGVKHWAARRLPLNSIQQLLRL
ncbi:rib72 protein-like protein [Strigomonas culicis]|uniref:Rib72 protein-like protein n=1 Tax=Strigomonas culicis TaxID=28005 RepID=S9W080_9TRYP|nr:rib72 protein-like protein [Strigomonas culicis]|eukprot:EPY29330.1 rib72 protein-like protein [Strigomonas culicis]